MLSQSFYRRLHWDVSTLKNWKRTYNILTLIPQFDDMLSFSDVVFQAFLELGYSKVRIAYTRVLSRGEFPTSGKFCICKRGIFN